MLTVAYTTHRLAPADAADACSTNLFNPVLGDWDDDILDFVMGGGENNATKIGKMRELLGEVEKDGGIEVSCCPLCGRSGAFGIVAFSASVDRLNVDQMRSSAASRRTSSSATASARVRPPFPPHRPY